MENNKTIDFISNLAFRFRNENDLSDITWTMCQTSKTFLDAFLYFFFPQVEFGDVTLVREFTEDDSRVDFYIKNREKNYLIENKIWDRNQHFEQYIERYKINPDQLGYITNYSYQKEGFVVHTWTEFYIYLNQKCTIPENESDIWTGYLNYLKNVCCIFIPTVMMNLDGMYSLYTFYRCLDNVFACETDKYLAKLYDSRKDTNNGGNVYLTPRDGVMGKYFEVTFKGIEMKTVYGWMGVYFEREHPSIHIGFDHREGWGKSISDLKDPIAPNGGKTFGPSYKEDDTIWFDFIKGKDFDDAKTVDDQIKLLKTFYIDVLDVVYQAKKRAQ